MNVLCVPLGHPSSYMQRFRVWHNAGVETGVGSCSTREREEKFVAKLRRLCKDIVVKYGRFSLAVLSYHTSIHSLTIQGHCIYGNRIRTLVECVIEVLTVAAFVENDNPTRAAIPT